ncbi:hypothetical protein [Microseira wollei]|uniref:hypothetical protein n=1 Tax=Microseira wollei TaxID=467598 RepID=UPI001CFF39CA|nr:hypothetical protein [Microseira wollei]
MLLAGISWVEPAKCRLNHRHARLGAISKAGVIPYPQGGKYPTEVESIGFSLPGWCITGEPRWKGTP